MTLRAGADPGGHLKKLRRAEGGANIFWVFRVKNHDFTQKKIIFYSRNALCALNVDVSYHWVNNSAADRNQFIYSNIDVCYISSDLF